ncbi:ATP phosphoribosyltransferase [Coriobacteriales bacterium OH1046]|nr:ATP phosphoribosyltransferase [Coriobacteriales bacterium OH1046]
MALTTPSGFRDILPHEALVRERISGAIRDCFSAHGYLPVETPLLEMREVLEQGSSIDDMPFQLFDSDGALLMLRPDSTLPIARMIAGRIGGDALPLRLRYQAPVVREEAALGGQPRQFTQAGIELVGEKGAVAELEAIRLLAEAFAELEVPDWRIVLGSVAPLEALLAACAPDDAFRRQVRRLVHSSDFVGLDELVAQTSALAPETARALTGIVRLSGGGECIAVLDGLLASAGVAAGDRGSEELAELVRGVSDLLASDRASFDFSVMNSFDYYTGLIFKGYSGGIAAALATGGRYDSVLRNFGRDGISACGFALSLERLQEVLGEQGESGIVASGAVGRPLRIAVPKGSLFPGAVASLEAAGLPVDELEHPGRKLVISAGDVEYVIVRAIDAPTFVAHGGADCGICGSDALLEANLDLVQLLDLGFGGCRLCVAEPVSAHGAVERAQAWRGTVRVTTKYPHLTRAYYDRIGQQADIITLHGNIELGPLLGMTDRIVDITATGTTLAENDLAIVDEVMSCSARFFASPAAYRCDGRIRALADRLATR